MLDADGGFAKPVIYTWSLIEQYETCPFKAYHQNVIKDIPWVETVENKWGNEVHSALERCARLRVLPEDRFKELSYIAAAFLSATGELRPEVKLGVDRRLHACDFYDPNVFIRGNNADLIIDYNTWAVVWDYKTGKKKTGSKQLMLTALMVFAKFPRLEKLICSFIWTQAKTLKPEKEIYYRHQIPEMWKRFLVIIGEIEHCNTANIWYKRQNGLCRAWCPVTECEYNGRHK
jgi:hypothetical protein